MKYLSQNSNAVYSFSFQPIDSKMYILIVNNEALVIDPNESEEAFQLLKEQRVEKVSVLLTHEHYDHISGVNKFKKHFQCEVIAQKQCAANIQNIKKNLSNHFDVLMQLAYGVESEDLFAPYTCEADSIYEGQHELQWQGHKIECIHTPGHSEGSVCIIVDATYLFIGDSLIKGKKVLTKLPGGSRKEYQTYTLPFLKSLPLDLMVLPGHGEPGVLHEFLAEAD